MFSKDVMRLKHKLRMMKIYSDICFKNNSKQEKPTAVSDYTKNLGVMMTCKKHCVSTE